MKRMFYTVTLVGIFLLLAFNVDAKIKKKIYKGYVVTTQGDTIHGKIQMLSPTLNEVKVKFINNEGIKRIYRAKELDGYAFKVPEIRKKKYQQPAEWIYYIKKEVEYPPVPFGSTIVLMQRQVNGRTNMYNYYIETRSRETEYDHIIYVEKGTTMVKISKQNYKKVIKRFLEDYPALQAKVGKRGYGFKHIENILKEYNAYIATKREALPSIR